MGVVPPVSPVGVPPGEGHAVSSSADANAAKSGPIILNRRLSVPRWGVGTFTVDGYTHCNPSKDLIMLEYSTVSEKYPVLSEENSFKAVSLPRAKPR